MTPTDLMLLGLDTGGGGSGTVGSSRTSHGTATRKELGAGEATPGLEVEGAIGMGRATVPG